MNTVLRASHLYAEPPFPQQLEAKRVAKSVSNLTATFVVKEAAPHAYADVSNTPREKLDLDPFTSRTYTWPALKTENHHLVLCTRTVCLREEKGL